MSDALGSLGESRAIAGDAQARVLHIIDHLGLGGAQAALKTYLEANTTGDMHTLYSLRVIPKQLVIGHADVFIDPSASRFSLAALWRVRRLIVERRITILHCHLFRAQAVGYLTKRLFFPGLALVFHEHGRAAGREGESWVEALAFRVFLQLSRGYVRHFICNAEHVKRMLLELIPSAADRTTVVPYPVVAPSPVMSRAEIAVARTDLGIPQNAFVVGFAGRLIERKGWREFLFAVRRVSEHRHVFFLIAGDGPDRHMVEASIDALGLQSCGCMLGHVGEMRRFYALLDCLIMPSHWEPHGLSHIEAQSYGVPVVVSDVPGLRDTVNSGHDALLFSVGDATALADRVLEIASDASLRSRLSRGGLDNAARFSVDAFCSRMDTIYSGLYVHTMTSKTPVGRVFS